MKMSSAFLRIVYATIVLFLTIVVSTATRAGEFDPGRVGAGAKWIVHLDLDAMRDSILGQFMRSKWMIRDRIRQKTEKILERTGVDPREDLQSVTMYGDRFEKHMGTALIEARNIDAHKLLSALREKHPGVRVSTYDAHNLYVWKGKHHDRNGRYTTAALHSGAIIVISNESAAVMSALDILDGKTLALSETSSLAAAVTKGTMLLMRGTDMSNVKLPFNCPVLRKSDNFSLAAGQKENRIFLNTSVTTNTPEVAANAVAVVGGLRAMVMLRHGKNQHIHRVIEGLRTSTDVTNLKIEWEVDGCDVLHAADSLKEFHKRRMEDEKK